MSDATCKTCRWFSPKLQTEFRTGCGAAMQKGSCRINPPVHGGWPTTWEDYWCGEHPDRQGRVEYAEVTQESFPTEDDMRRIVGALEKMASRSRRMTP